MTFQTPMLALGLPHTRSHRRDIASVRMKEAVLIRQRRVLVSAVLTALCLSVVITWRLFMHLPSSPQRSLHRTLPPKMVQKKQRLKKVTPMINDQQRKGEEQLDLRSFHDEKQIVIVLTHFRDSDSCAHTLVNARAMAFLASRVHFRRKKKHAYSDFAT
ncbi:hypothetical protein PsorP6_012927 [Peronosclerospora sorghi]|uniref:Uncharacterized protein n=1 Tax=Peronosclerospora sorghi TaxID=230839 RepID=A0ACC0WF13_9STRA|nr:hypothetical protein PsorP6_012927 [Peronosclerospora sorghi]